MDALLLLADGGRPTLGGVAGGLVLFVAAVVVGRWAMDRLDERRGRRAWLNRQAGPGGRAGRDTER